MKENIDKSKECNVSLSLLNDKLNFEAKSDLENSISIDYIPPYGDNLGFTSLELLLMSLASCYGTSVLIVLRKMQFNIKFFKINAYGKRKQTHPTSFEIITLNIEIEADNLKSEDFQKAAKLTEESLCPVYDMLKNNVEIITKFTII